VSPAGTRPHEWRRLLQLLRERSLTRGDFLLSSGRRSNYYIDARITTMSGRGQMLIGRVGLAALDEAGWRPAAIGGLTLGADPIACAIAHTACLDGRATDAFTVRKQPKTHGTGKRIEGPFPESGSIVIIEDTITTGGSALDAVQAVTDAGGSILGILALVDREEGGRERIEAQGYPVTALYSASELLAD
jgi:orotate phosphoribosyltransferase